jgi:hypothetical protein
VKPFIAAVFFVLPLAAQDPPSPIINVYREEVKPGRMSAYVRIEEDAARFCAKAGCPNPYLAINSITGPREVWWINGFDSTEAMEKVWQAYAASVEISRELNAVDESKADLAFPATNLMARFRPEMSFHTSQIFPRFLLISVIHVRPGHVASFRDTRVRFKTVLERAGRPQWTYQVTSGTDDVTFLVMTPGRSMQDI